MFQFREFKPSDLNDVMKIVNRVLRSEYTPEFYIMVYKAWKEGFLVATHYEKIAGLLISGITMTRKLRILLLITLPEYRNQGLASSMLNNIIKRGLRLGIYLCRLEVRVNNADAIKFYLKNDFKICKRITGYYKNGDDALIMEKVLSS